jgi:hypothetical protein
VECNLESAFEILREKFIASGGNLDTDYVRSLEDAKRRLVLCLASSEIEKVLDWVVKLREHVDKLRLVLNLKGYTYPREFASFVTNPVEHLKKKLFNYVDDYMHGRYDYQTFVKKALSAITTSLRTNARSCYQLWGLAVILMHLGESGYEVAYPEHRFINFDRSGKQKLGVIPPNIVLVNYEKGFLSFYQEAPRPLSWEDTSDLQKVWSLYTALRPDLMIYGGKVLNIVDLDATPPIKKPNVIVEFKELEDWYLRVRDLKGYFKKPLTAEEWRYRWWSRLREELIKIADLKVEASEFSTARSTSTREPSMRIREYQLVLMYKAMYKPDEMILVSRSKVPMDVERYLESNGVLVFDDVGFNPEKLRDVVHELEKYVSYGDEETVTIEVPRHVAHLVSTASKALGLGYIETLEHALRLLLSSIEKSRVSMENSS